MVIYSGGMDSYTVLHKAIEEGLTPYALTFDYGQRHVKEVQVAEHNTEHLRNSHIICETVDGEGSLTSFHLQDPVVVLVHDSIPHSKKDLVYIVCLGLPNV